MLTLQGTPLSDTVFKGPCPASDTPCAPGMLCAREAAAAADAAWAAASSACLLASSSCRLACARYPDPARTLRQVVRCTFQACLQTSLQGSCIFHLPALCLQAGHGFWRRLKPPSGVLAGHSEVRHCTFAREVWQPSNLVLPHIHAQLQARRETVQGRQNVAPHKLGLVKHLRGAWGSLSWRLLPAFSVA